MKKQHINDIRRLCWYTAGLYLFFAPFAYYQKGLIMLFGSERAATIHTMCLRTPLLYITSGNFNHILTISFLSFLIILLLAFIFGPVFCGRFCATGALPEYLSRIVPVKWQIDWSRRVNPAPVRYGFLSGFLLSPLLGGTIAHTYCNFNLTEKLLYAGIEKDLGLLTSTTIITAFLWLGLLGLLTKGGRGFCNFLCPVGALQSMVYRLGIHVGFSYRIRKDRHKCVECRLCADKCPMGAWNAESITHQVDNCITCRQCEHICPTEAISFDKGVVREPVGKGVTTS